MFKHLKSPAIAGKRFVLLFLFIAVMIVGIVSDSYCTVYGRLKVRVIKKDTEKAVAKLSVYVFDIESGKQYKGITDNKGYVVFEKLRAKRRYKVMPMFENIEGSKLAYVPERYVYFVDIAPGKAHYITVKLVLGGLLTGKLLIKDEKGVKPLKGKYIYCVGKDVGSYLERIREDGKFYCIGRESEYFITLDRDYKRGKTNYFRYFKTKVKVKMGEIRDLGDIIAYDFTDKTGIEGYVYSKETDKPIEGASIIISKKVERFKGVYVKLDYISTETDKNGYFNASPLPEGEYNVNSYLYSLEENKTVTEYKTIKVVKVNKGRRAKINIFLKYKK